MNTSTTWTIARNERTSLYEIHADGCRHTTMSRHLDVMVTGYYDGLTGREAKARYEADNEGCLAKLGPCAR
jgi:hypothetical protein